MGKFHKDEILHDLNFFFSSLVLPEYVLYFKYFTPICWKWIIRSQKRAILRLRSNLLPLENPVLWVKVFFLLLFLESFIADLIVRVLKENIYSQVKNQTEEVKLTIKRWTAACIHCRPLKEIKTSNSGLKFSISKVGHVCFVKILMNFSNIDK